MRDAHAAEQNDTEEHHHHGRPRDSKFLADHGKNKIAVRLRQVEHLLPTRAETDAPTSPRAQCNKRLHQLKTGAARNDPGVQRWSFASCGTTWRMPGTPTRRVRPLPRRRGAS